MRVERRSPGVGVGDEAAGRRFKGERPEVGSGGVVGRPRLPPPRLARPVPLVPSPRPSRLVLPPPPELPLELAAVTAVAAGDDTTVVVTGSPTEPAPGSAKAEASPALQIMPTLGPITGAAGGVGSTPAATAAAVLGAAAAAAAVGAAAIAAAAVWA